MSKWRNASGRPLSSLSWLEAHHQAKLPERTSFAKTVLAVNPQRIVDLGCGPGMWLSLFNEHAAPQCELVGLDSDESAILLAQTAAEAWPRRTSFVSMDIEKYSDQIPEADVFLAFNIFPYLSDPISFLERLKSKITPGGMLVVRQYDGNLLRFGPIDQQQRLKIETSLYTALGGSQQFRHYDLDRVFDVVNRVSFPSKQLAFELFSRVSPFPPEFVEYFENTVQWTADYISDEAKDSLGRWSREYLTADAGLPSYFVEVDLVAWISQ
jgi:SAM-dependent methyltransferase